MGFLERLFGRKEEVTTEAERNTLDINATSNFLNIKYNEKFDPFKGQVKSKYNEIQATLRNLKSNLSSLEKANFQGPLDSASIQIAISQRKSFINKLKVMINQLNKPLDLSFDSIIDYVHSSLISVTEVDNHTVKEFSFFEKFFEKESEAIFENFKTVFKITKTLSSLVSEEKNLLNPIINAQNELASLKENMEDVREKEKEIVSYDERLLGLQKRLKYEEEKMKNLEASDEWNKFSQSLEKKKELISSISEIKSNISQNFSKIDRPLKKFQHLIQSGKEKIEDEKILNRCLDSPVDFLIETGNFTFVNSILEKVKRSISSGVLDLKDKGKSLSEINWMMENNIFEELTVKYKSIVNEIEKIEKTISEQSINKLKNEIENSIAQLNRETQETGAEINRNKKQIEKLNISIQERKSNLEKTLANFGNRATIKLE